MKTTSYAALLAGVVLCGCVGSGYGPYRNTPYYGGYGGRGGYDDYDYDRWGGSREWRRTPREVAGAQERQERRLYRDQVERRENLQEKQAERREDLQQSGDWKKKNVRWQRERRQQQKENFEREREQLRKKQDEVWDSYGY